jgi:acetyl esterase/lipase
VFDMTHPRQDGLRAVRLVRHRASEWGVDPKRIGMVGFSAGGEVVSMTAFGDTAGDAAATDPIDRVSARPDFVVHIYPGPVGIPEALPADAPPAFLLVANDDGSTRSVLRLFQAYRTARAPVEVHVFAKGAHAFNMGTRSKLSTIKNWPQRLADWMADNNLLDPAVPAKGVK